VKGQKSEKLVIVNSVCIVGSFVKAEVKNLLDFQKKREYYKYAIERDK
jgi:hypothetical protein